MTEGFLFFFGPYILELADVSSPSLKGIGK